MITDPQEFKQKLLDIQNSINVTYNKLPSDEPRFIIDANSRTIKIPLEFGFLGVKNDHKAENIYFEIDRYYDEEDLVNHTCVIQYKSKNREGLYPVDYMDITSVEDKIIFCWTIMNDVTEDYGNIEFSVRFYSIDNDEYTYNFNTLPATSKILDTLDVNNYPYQSPTPEQFQIYIDKTNEMSAKIDEFSTDVTESENNAKIYAEESMKYRDETKNISVEEIEKIQQAAEIKAQEVIASIPEDYTTLSDSVDDLKSDCVKWTPYKNIFNKDSSDKVDRFYINMANGYKNVNSNFSAYILPIESGSTISVSGFEGTQIGFASEYTDLSTLGTNAQVNGWISGTAGGNGIQVPSNAKYLFVSSNSNFISNLQVEYNDVATSYEPYKLVVPNTRELQEQIDNLDSHLENKIDYVQSKNIFNKDSSDKVDGFWINNTNGNAYKNINSELSIFTVPVIGGKTISISGCSSSAQYAFCTMYTNVATLATNGILSGYISGSNFNEKLEGLVVPDNAKYLMISTNTTWFPGVQVEYKEKCTSYEPYGKLIPTDGHIVKVGVGEDFETLKSGIEYATQLKNSIVKVKKGVYDLVEEFGSELETSKGLILKNNVHVIFEIGSKVTFNYTGDSQNVHINFSPFNSGEYGFTIENLDLEASNCRYCVHDERGNTSDFYHNVYKNCRMKLDNSNNPDWVNPQNIGTGLSNGVIEIENCRFNNYITFHNNNGTSTNSKSNVYIKDCYFERGSIILGSYGNSTEISNFYISGNSLGGNITNQDTESTALVNIELHAWNNEIRTV